MKSILVISISSLLLLTNCNSERYKNNFHSSQKSQIINGIEVLEKDPLASHTVLVHDKKNGYICTGVIILNNTILTAAHCLTGKNGRFEIIFSPRGYDLIDEKSHPELILPAEHFTIHHDYISDFRKQPGMNQSDLGLITLHDKLPPGYSPAQVMMDDHMIKSGQVVTMVGYGVTQISATDVKYKKSQKFKQAIQNGEIICDNEVKDQSGNPTCIEVSADGDGHLMKTSAAIKNIYEHEFVLDEVKSGTCEGDSGGPVFVEENGVQYLIGITSRGDLLCNGIGIYTSVPFFIDWILSH